MSPHEWVDDLAVTPDEILWRAVHPTQVVRDPVTELLRPSSGVFRSSHQTSVFLVPQMTLDEFVALFPNHGLVAVSARIVRDEGCKIVRDPVDSHRSHCLVIGAAKNGCLTKTQAEKIIKQATWIILPNGFRHEASGSGQA